MPKTDLNAKSLHMCQGQRFPRATRETRQLPHFGYRYRGTLYLGGYLCSGKFGTWDQSRLNIIIFIFINVAPHALSPFALSLNIEVDPDARLFPNFGSSQALGIYGQTSVRSEDGAP